MPNANHRCVMELVERPEVNVQAGPCKVCSVSTRSHIVRPPLYEEYTAEEIIGESDEYATKSWIETEEIVKYRLVEDAIVLCHKCWAPLMDKAIKKLANNFDRWCNDVGANMQTIRSFLRNWDDYGFGNEGEVEQVKELKKAVRGFSRGE